MITIQILEVIMQFISGHREYSLFDYSLALS